MYDFRRPVTRWKCDLDSFLVFVQFGCVLNVIHRSLVGRL